MIGPQPTLDTRIAELESHIERNQARANDLKELKRLYPDASPTSDEARYVARSLRNDDCTDIICGYHKGWYTVCVRVGQFYVIPGAGNNNAIHEIHIDKLLQSNDTLQALKNLLNE